MTIVPVTSCTGKSALDEGIQGRANDWTFLPINEHRQWIKEPLADERERNSASGWTAESRPIKINLSFCRPASTYFRVEFPNGVHPETL
jgi:hypothetical protein